MLKRYTGKEQEKIAYQKTLNTIEDNIKYKIPTLRVIFIINMKYYRVLEVVNIIDYVINITEDKQTIKRIKEIKSKINSLRSVTIENEEYYNGFEINKILDFTINKLYGNIFHPE